METNRTALRLLTACVPLALSSFALGQGALAPPPGAPAPTMKSLDQVEARTIVNAANTPGDATNTFIISTPGSYYLTGNITGAPGKHGISILANNVTLDLNGFALISGGGGAFRGVNTTTPITSFCIRNGSVSGWTGGGVRAEFAITVAENLRLSDNTGATGLTVGNGSTIRDCLASNNATGFYCPDRTQISNCIATVNTGIGFDCTSYVTLVDCTASRNSGSAGIAVQGSSTVIRCNASRNISGGNGIVAGAGCTIADCTAGSNGFFGISVDAGSTVRGCTAQANDNFGIAVTDNCQVIGNTCDLNSQSGASGGGIAVFGNGNRIDGNSCTSSSGIGFGIRVYPGANNLIVRNSAHGNAPGSSYAFEAGNRYGPIVDLTANNPNTVSNAAPSTAGSTDPWANFIY